MQDWSHNGKQKGLKNQLVIRIKTNDYKWLQTIIILSKKKMQKIDYNQLNFIIIDYSQLLKQETLNGFYFINFGFVLLYLRLVENL